ncbi:hypothetical protein D3C86_1461600 [compost metagenome]
MAKKQHSAPRTALVPYTYPLTLYAKKVSFKEDYLFVVQPDKQKHRIPYKDVITVDRVSENQVRVTFQTRGDWAAPVGKTGSVRINKYIVRYDRKGQEPIYVRQKEAK